MHRVEQRLMRAFLEQLFCRRHIVHFVECDIVRRGYSDHQHEMRDDDYGGRNGCDHSDWTIRNKGGFACGLGGTFRQDCVFGALDIARFFFSNRFALGVH
jgi:hypothetical protein